MVGSSVLVRSRLSTSIQPPIANFLDNPDDGNKQDWLTSRLICLIRNRVGSRVERVVLLIL